MPFVKRDVTAPSTEGRPADDTVASHVAALSSPDSETRWSAARALGGRADAVPALAAALARGTGRTRARSDHDGADAGRRRGQRHGAAALSSLPGRRPARREHRGAAGPAGGDPAVHDVAAGGRRFRRAAAGDRIGAQHVGGRTPPGYCAACSRTSSIPMSARRRSTCWRRSARGRRCPRCRPAPNASPERRFCHSPCRSPSPGFRTRNARAGMAGSETHGAACRPRYPGGRSASVRIPLSPDRNVVRRQQALLHRSPPRRANCGDQIGVVPGVFRHAAVRRRPRDRTSDQRLHGE